MFKILLHVDIEDYYQTFTYQLSLDDKIYEKVSSGYCDDNTCCQLMTITCYYDDRHVKSSLTLDKNTIIHSAGFDFLMFILILFTFMCCIFMTFSCCYNSEIMRKKDEFSSHDEIPLLVTSSK